MPTPTPLRLTAILAISLALADPAAAEGPPRPAIRALELAKFAKAVAGFADKLELLDDLTEAKSDAHVAGVGRSEAEGASFVAAYRICDIELSKGLTNRLWLLGDVPGRGIATSIRTDCLVHEWRRRFGNDGEDHAGGRPRHAGQKRGSPPYRAERGSEGPAREGCQAVRPPQVLGRLRPHRRPELIERNCRFVASGPVTPYFFKSSK